jgi:hypothetical protein
MAFEGEIDANCSKIAGIFGRGITFFFLVIVIILICNYILFFLSTITKDSFRKVPLKLKCLNHLAGQFTLEYIIFF